MTAMPEIDVRDLGSVRRAAAEADVVLGDDWVIPDSSTERTLMERRRRRGLTTLRRSPLARKIITFNLVALILLVAGVLYLNPSRDGLVFQRADGLVSEAELIADSFEAQISPTEEVDLAAGIGVNAVQTLQGLDLRRGIEVYVFDPGQALVAGARAGSNQPVPGLLPGGNTYISDFLSGVWNSIDRFGPDPAAPEAFNLQEQARAVAPQALAFGNTVVETIRGVEGNTFFLVATPIFQRDTPLGVVAVISAAGEIEALVRQQREIVLQLFILGSIVSVGLSLLLASTIANPLSDLAEAAELGRDRNARKMAPSQIRIPDLTARPDEIGRLSGALRGMIAALYDRIEGNEQFAADVAHEIKNPLASLRSAVGTMRIAKRDDQRERLLEVIEHDVNRLDRLVSDISNASRLDSELVRDDEEPFDLIDMLRNMETHLGKQARERGIDFIADLPNEAIILSGLEGRLAQVFVNLITNAISFCEEGDAIRVWARRRDARVLVVVEDTGPGIPDNALAKVFKRFYSERPEGQFGNNSGLGLAISKQIVEAHGGVIWAENIRPTDADPTSDPLGARFVVGLPV